MKTQKTDTSKIVDRFTAIMNEIDSLEPEERDKICIKIGAAVKGSHTFDDINAGRLKEEYAFKDKSLSISGALFLVKDEHINKYLSDIQTIRGFHEDNCNSSELWQRVLSTIKELESDVLEELAGRAGLYRSDIQQLIEEHQIKIN